MKGFVLFLCAALNASGVILAWDYNSETNVLGYRVYWGSASRDYTSVFDVGNTNLVQLPTLPGTTYYAVTAYDLELLESDFSDEVFYTKPNTPPRAPLNLRISGTNEVSTVKLLQSTNLFAWTETGQAFVPVVNGGTVFYKAAAPAPPKSFLSAMPSKSGKLITRRPPRVVPPPPMPPEINR